MFGNTIFYTKIGRARSARPILVYSFFLPEAYGFIVIQGPPQPYSPTVRSVRIGSWKDRIVDFAVRSSTDLHHSYQKTRFGDSVAKFL